MRRDEDPNRSDQEPQEQGPGDASDPREEDAGGRDDQEAMEPDLGTTG